MNTHCVPIQSHFLFLHCGILLIRIQCQQEEWGKRRRKRRGRRMCVCLSMSWAKGRGCCMCVCMGGGDRKHSQRWPSISLFAPHSCPHSHNSRRACHKLQSSRSNLSSPETNTHICISLQSASLFIIPTTQQAPSGQNPKYPGAAE